MAEKDQKRPGNTWVLETQTKGTGANMVPLERTMRKRGAEAPHNYAFPRLKRPPAETPGAREPRVFRVVDVVSRETLADEVDSRAAVRCLEDVRSIVDVNVFVWEPESERWRRLTFSEKRTLWDHRRR